jgi:hypothetical protein
MSTHDYSTGESMMEDTAPGVLSWSDVKIVPGSSS